MLPADGWALRFSTQRHTATPARKSGDQAYRIDSQERRAGRENCSKNRERVEVIVQANLGYQPRCTPGATSLSVKDAAGVIGNSLPVTLRPPCPKSAGV